ncbi:hypothetical protein, partial [Escherichia coli]|uniref:hypothetical protein n=1 Tax=Escherichia coli TaxID=562 RepID=UPI00207BB4F9
KQKKLIMLPSETMIWQPEFTDKTLSRKPGAVHSVNSSIAREGKWLTYAKKRAAENARYVFTAYAMAILKLQFWHITGWLEFAERE